MSDSKYLQVLDYLRTYGGKQYKKAEKCESPEELAFMEKGSEEGKKARNSFTGMVQLLNNKTDLSPEKITQWQNSGVFVSYFWCQLKRIEAKDSNISLSLFAEKSDQGYRFRASIELAVNHSTEQEKTSYRKILDIPLDDKLVYISGGNNESDFRTLEEKDNKVVKQMNLKKVQVSFVINEQLCSDSAFVESKLLESISTLIKYYDCAIGYKTEKQNDIWWPSLDEYDPGISKEQWLEFLKDGSTFTANALEAAVDMYKYGGTASCKQLEIKYGNTADFYRTTLGVQLADKVRKKLSIELCKDDGKSSLWPVLFQGRNAEKEEPGSFVWKMRPELYDALTNYLSGENKMDKLSQSDVINRIKYYAQSQGFNCDKDLIENIYLSLHSKPFVILAGVSGTGKSWITRLFAEAIGAGDNYEMISVRPDWSDASELLGYVNLDGKFIPGMLTSVIEKAARPGNEDKIFFVCLDEMNLARVEYYFSDFLSVIETREWNGNRIVTRKIFKENSFGPDTDKEYQKKYGLLSIPDNVYIIGTVNMDETTHPFSKKVLDRANTIELSEIDLRADIKEKEGKVDIEKVAPIALDNKFLRSKYLDFKSCYNAHPDEMDHIINILERINKALQPINAQVAYRVRNEIAYYVSYAIEDGLLSFDQAMDNALMQKILPRIQGEGHRIKNGLGGVLDAVIPGMNFSNEDDLLLAIENYLKTAGDDYPYSKSIQKIRFMLEGIKNNGYATYWL